MKTKLIKAKEKTGKAAIEASDKIVKTREKIATTTTKKMRAAQEKLVAANRDNRLKSLNPLFPEDFNAQNYELPEMIVIKDSSLRKSEKLCEGSIGWTRTINQLSIVHLYKTFAKKSDLDFYPTIRTNTIYMEDPCNPRRYIDLDYFFSTIEEEKVAELIEVGRCLGAKKCSVGTYKDEKKTSEDKKTLKAKVAVLKAKIAEGSLETTSTEENKKESSILSFQEFPGSNSPKRPPLEWFANEKAIVNLVESFFDGRPDLNPTAVRREITHSSSCTMSKERAGQIEGAVKKIGVSFAGSIESKAKKESRRTWVFSMEF